MEWPPGTSGQQLRITVGSDRLSATAEWPAAGDRPNWDVLRQALIRSGVVFGWIDPTEWERAPSGVPVAVARGREPQPACDDTVVLSSDACVQEWLGMNGQPGAPAVLSRQLVAVRFGGRPGAAGFTVQGGWIPSGEHRSLVLVGLRGVTQGVTPDVLVAAESGRLGVVEDGSTVMVEVVPVLTRQAETLEPAALVRHPGDVVIEGNLDKGQSIVAEGNVRVIGRVTGCKIRAGGSVVVEGGVINTEIDAGVLPMECVRLASSLPRLAETFGRMGSIVDSLKDLPAFRREDLRGGLAPLLQVLVEQKFGGFSALIQTVRASFENLAVRQYPVFVEVERSLLRAWHSGQFLGVHTVGDLLALQQALADAGNLAAQLAGIGGHVRVEHADHTRIAAGGSVDVSGSGVYRCNVSAQGAISVTGKVIGDELRSNVGITAASVRHHGGTRTVLSVPASGYIEVGEVSPDTEIRVGNQVRIIHQLQPVSWRK